MGRQVVEQTIVTDDVDGAELPGDTRPVELMHEGRTFSLYLSDAHRQELLDTLDRFTANVEPVSEAAPTRRGTKKRVRRSAAEVAEEKRLGDDKKKQRAAIEKFAKQKFADYAFPQRAAIRKDVVEAFYKENESATKHYA